MLKLTSLVYLTLFVTFTLAKYIDNSDRFGQLTLSSSVDGSDLNDKYLALELEKIDSALKNKRSDIDSRLLELQAKIDLVKAYQNMPAGHGKIDFNKIGKRSVDSQKSN